MNLSPDTINTYENLIGKNKTKRTSIYSSSFGGFFVNY